jgi:hypothetical protein
MFVLPIQYVHVRVSLALRAAFPVCSYGAGSGNLQGPHREVPGAQQGTYRAGCCLCLRSGPLKFVLDREEMVSRDVRVFMQRIAKGAAVFDDRDFIYKT